MNNLCLLDIIIHKLNQTIPDMEIQNSELTSGYENPKLRKHF